MATLNDSFLADLDELSDNEANLDENNEEDEDMEEDVDGDLADIEALNYDDLDSVSKLQNTQRYTDIMQKVEDALEKGSETSDKGIVLEDDPEYQLIVDCNALSVDIENEIVIIHNFIRDKYRLKFPELESLVHHPIDYARVVKKIGNEMDLTLVDLEGLLPSAIIMVISVTASTTSGKPLPEDVLQKTLDACDRALAIDSAKKKVLDFVESRMGYIAPNLSAIVGSAVAAKLMGTAGGLTALAKMPACNVQLLGAKKKNLAGFSTATSQFRVGYLEQTEIFQSTPPSLRMRACRLLAAKSTLAARVDSTRGDPTGKNGRSFRDEILKKIEKWQEPPPAKQPKPLPVPDSEPKKKRGGRRLRKMKERYAITDMRKLANRMQFGVPEESSLGDGLGEGYGMLGQAGNGKLRVSVGQSRLAAKVAKKFKEKQYGSSGATSGLTSSLAFTPVQWLMRGISIGHSHPKPCTGRKTSRRGGNNGEADNVILIDVDPDHFDNDVPESLPKKPRGSSILRKDKKWPFRTVICIDDDESTDDNRSGIGVNDNDSFSNGATHSKKSCFESKEFKNAADSAGEECEFVQENTTPVRLSKCKRTYSGKASTRNVYGPSVNSEIDLSGKDSPDCELMEDSSGELQKQWEKAFFRRKKDKRNGVYDAKDCDDTSKDFKDNHHNNVRKESNSGQHEEAPFCASTSKSSEENEAQSPFITKEDVNFGSAFFEGPTDEFSSQSELKTHMWNNQPDINERSHSGADYPPFNFAEQRSSFESDVENDISNVRAKTDKFEENVIVSDKDMEHSQPCEPGATRSVKEKENLMSENSSFVKFSSLNDQVKDNATLSSNKVGPVSGEAAFWKNSSLDPGDVIDKNKKLVPEIPSSCNRNLNETQVREDEAVEKLIEHVSNIQKEVERDDPQHTLYGDDSRVVENFIINEREKLKETDEYKKAIEEEWASRQRALQIQAEEAQRLRQLRKRQKAESMRLLDMERRQKQRVEEIRETQKKDEENMNLKEVIRSEVRTRLKQLETTCHDMASLLHSLGINLATWPHPSPHEVQTAYKRALLTFHPDRALQSDIRQQVEAEEKFKLINRLKDKFSASLRQ